MADDEQTPEFPNYPPGIPVADPGYHKPLLKMLKQFMKPRQKALHKRPLRWKKKNVFH